MIPFKFANCPLGNAQSSALAHRGNFSIRMTPYVTVIQRAAPRTMSESETPSASDDRFGQRAAQLPSRTPRHFIGSDWFELAALLHVASSPTATAVQIAYKFIAA